MDPMREEVRETHRWSYLTRKRGTLIGSAIGLIIALIAAGWFAAKYLHPRPPDVSAVVTQPAKKVEATVATNPVKGTVTLETKVPAPELKKPEAAPPQVSLSVSVTPPKPVPPAPKAKPVPHAKPKAKPKAVRRTEPAKPSVVAERWSHWGAAPYASSFEEACRKAPNAIDGSSLPQAVKDHFKTALGRNCAGGTIAWYTPDMRPEEMWSGPDRHHPRDFVMKNVPVAELPVLRSPDGRPYRKGSVAETAKVMEWTYTYRGREYVWYIPFVCFNEGWRLTAWIHPNEEACVEVQFLTHEGDIVRFGVLGDRRLPESHCFSLKAAGETEFRIAPVRCPDKGCDFSNDAGVLGLTVEHGGGYVAHEGLNVFRFPAAVAARGSRFVEVFCLERGGRQTMSVGIRWMHFSDDLPRRAVIYSSPEMIPKGLPPDYDLAWRW